MILIFLPTIILAKHNNNFEPVYSNKDKIFNIMDNMFLSILNEYKNNRRFKC